jgi:hypothetical protein
MIRMQLSKRWLTDYVILRRTNQQGRRYRAHAYFISTSMAYANNGTIHDALRQTAKRIKTSYCQNSERW